MSFSLLKNDRAARCVHVLTPSCPPQLPSDLDGHAGLAQGLREVVGVVSAIGDQAAEAVAVQEPVRHTDVGGLTGRQHNVDNPAERVDQGVRSEEHTSELQSLMRTSYAVFCLKKKKVRDEH